jgi:hypothetical protein
MIDIERRLVELGEYIDYPETPNFSAELRHRLAVQPQRLERPTWRRLALVAAAAVVVLALAAVAYPPTRDGIAKFLHLRGVTIERISTLPSPKPTPPAPDTVGLGELVTLEQARQAANFAVRIPTEPTATPAIRLGRTDQQPVVSLEYQPSAALPDPQHLGIGLLLTEFRGDLIPGFLGKFVGPDTTIEDVQVESVSGFWLAGAPHEIAMRGRNGEYRQETLRLAENTLVWERDGVTYRIESALSKADALRIAASLH